MRRILMLLYVFATAAGVSLADEATAVSAIEELGGSVRQIAQNSEDKEVAFHLSGKELTDDGLVHLKDIPNIVWLNLANTKITDAGLAQIASLNSLTKLHLEKTAITDAGLAHLSGLQNLEYLNLYGTQVTDAGLSHLKTLSHLQKLYLWQSQVTPNGVSQLKESIAADINLGAELKKPAMTLAPGQFVRIRLEGEKKILQLAEVEVLETGSETALHQSGTARQSSTYETAEAKLAIDGNAESEFSKGSVSHTAEQTNPWWVVDLGDTKDIAVIRIHNRGDCCGDRLQGAIVEIIDGGLNVVWNKTIEAASDKSIAEYVGE